MPPGYAATRSRAQHRTAAVWILIEYRGGWPPNGFDGLDLEPGDQSRSCSPPPRRCGHAVLLVRRHGRSRPEGPGRWAVLRYESSGAYRQQWGTWSRDEDLCADRRGPRRPRGTSAIRPSSWSAPTASTTPAAPCADGPWDVSSVSAGRTWCGSARTWAGDRFAANVVVVPDGVYYGGLDAGSSVDSGRRAPGRPYSRRPPARIHGPLPAAAGRCRSRARDASARPAGMTTRSSTPSATATDWRIRLSGRPPRPSAIDVEVRAHRTPPCRLTCRGPSMSSAVVYEVTSIRTG